MWRVAHRVPELTFVLRAFGAGGVCSFGLVGNLDFKLDVFASVGNVMRVEGIHGDTTEHVGDGRDRVC